MSYQIYDKVVVKNNRVNNSGTVSTSNKTVTEVCESIVATPAEAAILNSYLDSTTHHGPYYVPHSAHAVGDTF